MVEVRSIQGGECFLQQLIGLYFIINLGCPKVNSGLRSKFHTSQKWMWVLGFPQAREKAFLGLSVLVVGRPCMHVLYIDGCQTNSYELQNQMSSCSIRYSLNANIFTVVTQYITSLMNEWVDVPAQIILH